MLGRSLDFWVPVGEALLRTVVGRYSAGYLLESQDDEAERWHCFLSVGQRLTSRKGTVHSKESPGSGKERSKHWADYSGKM